MRFIVALLVFAAPAFAAGEQIEAAREAFVKGQYKKAVDLARPLVVSEGPAAWRVIGASACFLKDKPGAREAYGKLDQQGQAFLKYVCARQSIAIP
jgi:hypothetical protein